MNNSIDRIRGKGNQLQISEFWFLGTVTAVVAAICNLVLLLILGNKQFLIIAAATAFCSILFLASRWTLQKHNQLLSSVLDCLGWAFLILIHAAYWTSLFWVLLFLLWVFPVMIFTGLKNNSRRFSTFVPAIVSTLVMILIERYPLIERLSLTDLSIGRYFIPIYSFILGLFLFLLFLRGINTQFLYTRLLSAMIIIVFIPIVILSLITYLNTKVNDYDVAVNLLDQLATQRADEIQEWGGDLSNILKSVLESNDAYFFISNLLVAYSNGNNDEVALTRTILEPTLVKLVGTYGFEEILVMDPGGTVIASSRSELVDQDFRYAEFFWRGKIAQTILSPRYYPPEDEVSVFFSRPIWNLSNEVIGVLTGRANIESIILISQGSTNLTYETTRVSLLSADGALLESSSGRPSSSPQTEGAQKLLSSLQSGSGAYRNTDNLPVVGAYQWLPDLGVGLLAEATEADVYKQLPEIIANNLLIGTIAFILASVAATTIVRSITDPINSLVQATQDVISGKLETRIVTERDDELGVLTNAFNRMTNDLRALVTDLETRVTERTRALELRSMELQTTAQIAKDASLAPNMQELLDRTTRLIRDRLGYYHVAVFLNDDKNEYTVLFSAIGDAGKLMLANRHKLLIGETGIVGSVAKEGKPRIALDVGTDSVYLQNPLLPYTRSEMALPLNIGPHTLGVLDVQSDKVNAFDENDINVMSILTDQVAIAIERARLLEEITSSSKNMELAFRSQTSKAWRDYVARIKHVRGYRYEGVKFEPLQEMTDALPRDAKSGKATTLANRPGHFGSTVLVPITLRGQALGAIKIQFTTSQIPEETMHFLEEASNRLSLALENSRLVVEAEQRAEREQAIGHISSRIRETLDLDTILKTAMQELQKSFELSSAEIRLQTVEPDQSNPESQS